MKAVIGNSYREFIVVAEDTDHSHGGVILPRGEGDDVVAERMERNNPGLIMRQRHEGLTVDFQPANSDGG